MYFKIFLILSFFLFTVTKATSTLDEGHSCIIQHLKNKKKLTENFPQPVQSDLEKCKVVMPLILKNFESALRIRFTEKNLPNVNCLVKHIKNTGALDFMLVREIVPMSRSLENSEITQKTRNVTIILRKILLTGARRCKSPDDYAGLFEEILGTPNITEPVLRHNYCFTKYAIENHLIEVKHVNINPRRISLANINCEEMIDMNQVRREKQLLERLNEKDYNKEQIQCIMDEYRREKAFDSNIALEVIDMLHISYEEKRANREKIANRMEKFIKSIFICAKFLKHSSSVKTFHF
ncbi:hypothetical protein PVAND_004416 [Polypedilum vanderplanki]|uniref:Uncharacterized protein n=1 Tax=Polypedilum vanderplanki TaxID=319348 RepID=A0A9J6BY26_POLVA|nr:hypothetical protein PVAND_004416 [Polypedilum vanderplanki]